LPSADHQATKPVGGKTQSADHAWSAASPQATTTTMHPNFLVTMAWLIRLPWKKGTVKPEVVALILIFTL
jgi:hypothetical protein